MSGQLALCFDPKSDRLTAERARELLTYEPETGALRRRPETVHKINAGRVAEVVGTINKDGYLCVKLDGTVYLAHRVIFLMMEGRWPKPTVDHINRECTDNRWSNLREASFKLQTQNRSLVRPPKTQGEAENALGPSQVSNGPSAKGGA